MIFNFENALKKASGDLIFLSDQDDIWYNTKVEKFKENLKKNLLAFSNAAMFQGNDNSTSELFFKNSSKKTGLLNNLIKVKFLGATLAFQKAVLEKALPFPKNIPMHDIWIGLIAEIYGKTYFCSDKLLKYRKHNNNFSPTGGKSPFSFLKKLSFRYSIFINIIKRLIIKN